MQRRRQAIWAALVLVAAGAATGALFRREEAPVQPIAFSHQVHAGDFQIPCLYCHSYARRSPVAGVPSVERCFGCHKITAVNSPEVQKVLGYWKRREPIPWVRVHKLPDFVVFTHKRHVLAGLPCQTCHGPVETMPRVRQVAPLSMGWCLECHRQQGATLECFTCHH